MPRPWKPALELDGALQRGQLRYAVSLANELRLENDRPLRLETALRFLPLVAVDEPDSYDAWALRWLQRWLTESPAPTIEVAAEVAANLADLPADADCLERLVERATPNGSASGKGSASNKSSPRS
jgi:hypothetical protein